MRILVVHNRYLQAGGEDVVFEAESQMLEKNGHEVQRWQVDNRRVPRQSIKDKLSLGLQSIWSKASYDQMETTIESIRPDLVHIHNFFPLLSPAIFHACHKHKIPTVLTLHNYRLICPAATMYRNGKDCTLCVQKKFKYPAVQHGCYRHSRAQSLAVSLMLETHQIATTFSNKVTAYIALTQYGKEKFVLGGIPEAKIHIKPNFLDTKGVEIVKPHIGTFGLFVGRLTETKGIHQLVDAWLRVKPNFPLKIVGDGPSRATLMQRSGPTMEFLGQLDRTAVMQLMAEARFLIFPSIWPEGYPMTIVEAMSCGTPVLASRIGGIPELVREGKSGWLFDYDDDNDFDKTLRRASVDDSEVLRLGEGARRQFLSENQSATNYQKLKKVYAAAILAKQ